MITQGAFNLLFRAGLRRDFRDSFQEFETQYTMYLKQGRIDRPEIEATIMTGLSRLYERGDGEPVVYEDPKLGPKVAAVDKEFAAGFIITRRTVEDDQYNKAQQAAKWLGHAARMTNEFRSGALLDDAETGTDFKGIDGLALCHTAHTLINSNATVANRPAQEVGFGVTGITALLDLMENIKDENGDPMPTNPDTVIYNSGDITKAIQVFGSDKEPFTADNQDNAIPKRFPNRVKHIVKRYVVDSKSYMLVDSRMNDAHFLVRRAVEFDDTFDFDTDAAKYKATERILIWFVDWRGWSGAFPT
jgi:hypothetical protein